MMRSHRICAALAMSAAIFLAACGGGGSSGSTGGTAASGQSGNAGGAAAGSGSGSSTSALAAVSSGTVTAFGSVFVNGHEYSTAGAIVTDDDTGSQTTASNTNSSASGLAVGMTVSVKAADGSSSGSPQAKEIHVSAEARGTVDYSDTTASTLSVMGQTVNLSASTSIVDARSCALASPNTCTTTPATFAAQADFANYTSCSRAGSTYTCSNQATAAFVQVFGYLSSTTSSGNPSSAIDATLIVVRDNTGSPVYKAHGVLSTVGTGTPPTSFTLNGLTLQTSAACPSASSCAFSAGNAIAAIGTTAPVITGGSSITLSFTPAVIRARENSLLTAGSTVELQGVVSSVTSSANPKTFVLQGLTIDVGSGLTLPSTGDIVLLSGTVNADGSTITATNIVVQRSSTTSVVPFVIEDTLSAGAVTGSAAPFTVSVLGVPVVVSSLTRIQGGEPFMSSTSMLNISNFATYINGLSTPPHIIVEGYVDTSGSTPVFQAVEFRIKAHGSQVALGGKVTTALNNGVIVVDDIPVTLATTPAVTVSGSVSTAAGIAVGDIVAITGSNTTTTSGSTTSVTGITAATIFDVGTPFAMHPLD